MGASVRLVPWYLALAAVTVRGANWRPPHYFTTKGDHNYFPANDFALATWRRDLGTPPSSTQTVLHWRRHDQVGIGNALGGLTTAAIDAFVENRDLVLESRILQKFCEFVRCAIIKAPGDK